MAKSREYVVNVGNRIEHGFEDGRQVTLREGDSVPGDLTDEQLLSLRQSMAVVPKEVFEAQKGAAEAQVKAEEAKAEADAEAARALGQARDDANLAEREALVESLEAGSELGTQTVPVRGERTTEDVQREQAQAKANEQRSAEAQKAEQQAAKRQEELDKRQAQASANKTAK